MLENGAGFNSTSFGIARTLLRASEELSKPNNERLLRIRRCPVASLKFQLLSDEPIYEDFEILKLADGFAFLAVALGPDSDLVKKVLAGKSPRERAYELISGTKVRDPKVREQIWKDIEAAAKSGKPYDISTLNDPLVDVAKLVDAPSRAIRKKFENEIDEPKRQSYAALAKAKFAMDGDAVYPDATFTLRLAFGTVKGYKEDGKDVPPFTTMEGLYAEQGAEQQGAVRVAETLGGTEGQARSEDAVQLRLHCGHHRRQLRLAGHQQEGRSGRPDLRRQHSVAGARLHLRSGASAGGVRG